MSESRARCLASRAAVPRQGWHGCASRAARRRPALLDARHRHDANEQRAQPHVCGSTTQRRARARTATCRARGGTARRHRPAGGPTPGRARARSWLRACADGGSARPATGTAARAPTGRRTPRTFVAPRVVGSDTVSRTCRSSVPTPESPSVESFYSCCYHGSRATGFAFCCVLLPDKEKLARSIVDKQPPPPSRLADRRR